MFVPVISAALPLKGKFAMIDVFEIVDICGVDAMVTEVVVVNNAQPLAAAIE